MKRLSVDSILKLMSQVDDTVPLRIEDDSGEIYTFNVSRAKYAKAIKDKTFARQLLMSHKNAIHKQSTNALSTSEHGSSCVQDLVELHLCDGNDNNKQYILLVSKTDYERATNNVLYAAELLENHKTKNKEKQRHDLTLTSSPSNSKAIIDKQSSNILSTSDYIPSSSRYYYVVHLPAARFHNL
ncbi:uncharacterized protein LOC116416716 [Nasonia vitripennis]|uniref:Uncharacterized protein n=1 Tax=Nasonia vitripennis TaxID=7425 RepID=A0A7M7Q4L1_NASVI|nr:uncharacterized protein LOC116416716 [Nasonia vitripennis]